MGEDKAKVVDVFRGRIPQAPHRSDGFNLAARKLANYDPVRRVPAIMNAIADAVRWAEEIMREIDSRWPAKES